MFLANLLQEPRPLQCIFAAHIHISTANKGIRFLRYLWNVQNGEIS